MKECFDRISEQFDNIFSIFCILVELYLIESVPALYYLIEKCTVGILESQNLEYISARLKHNFSIEYFLQRHEGYEGSDQFYIDSALLPPNPFEMPIGLWQINLKIMYI